MSILIKNGRVIDPDTRKDGRYDILIEEDKIVKVDQEIKEEAEEVIDAEGCYVMPGLIDLHVHLRDPGQTYKETVETGAAAAASGGRQLLCGGGHQPRGSAGRTALRFRGQAGEGAAPLSGRGGAVPQLHPSGRPAHPAAVPADRPFRADGAGMITRGDARLSTVRPSSAPTRISTERYLFPTSFPTDRAASMPAA